METVLVAGATGLVGKELVLQLCNSDECLKVIVLSRKELNYSHPKIENRVIHFDGFAKLEIQEKIDSCFCCLGTTQKKMGREGMLKVDYDYVLELGKFCVRSGISKYLVVSSQMANPQSASFYMRTKGQMEIAVGKLEIPTIIFLRPSLLVGAREEKRLTETLGYYVYKLLTPIMIGKLRKMRAISGWQVAHAMIVLAKRNEQGKFYVESDDLSDL